MASYDADAGFCPQCSQYFKIVAVKFRLRGVQVVAACPNCALVCNDGFSTGTSDRQRLWTIIVFVVAALLVAATLRHALHIYGGMLPEEIRAYSLLALMAAGLLLIAWRASRRSRLISKRQREQGSRR